MGDLSAHSLLTPLLLTHLCLFWQLNLSDNHLCGVLDFYGTQQEGNYNAEGINAIADALRVNGALTSVELKKNKLGDEGWGAIFAAICGNKDSKIMSLNASFENIGPAGVQLIAEALHTSATGGLTSIDLSGNQLCGIRIDLSGNQQGTYTAEGITAIADALRVNGGLTRVDVRSNNIAGDGAAQLAAAVLGNLKIERFNEIPIKEMRADSFTELHLSWNDFGVEGGMVVACLIPVMGGLTKISLAANELGEEGTKAICEALEQNKTLKELDISGDGSGASNIGGSAGATHVAKMLGVNGGLTSIDLSNNQLCGVWTDYHGQHGTYTAEGITAIADAMRVNGALTVTNLLGNKLDAESAKMLAEVAKRKGISLCGIQVRYPTNLKLQRDQTTADFSGQGLNPPDAILLASDLSQAVVTGGLTKLSLAENKLGKEGTKFLCDALVGNNTLKELDLSGEHTYQGTVSNIGGTAGAKHVANMLLVNGGLTVTNLLLNQLDAESAKMLAEVAKQKGISLCGIRHDQTTADFSDKFLELPDAILLASDLSQAVVTGTLTKIE